uniref:Putative secreted protein n=2 Tax=argyritarsis section TaxID=44545 RepID=A0A2M4D4X8_ANODA
MLFVLWSIQQILGVLLWNSFCSASLWEYAPTPRIQICENDHKMVFVHTIFRKASFPSLWWVSGFVCT